MFDEAEVRGELVEYYRNHHKSPGEPLLVPEFRHNHAISQQVPRPEQQRRDETGRMKLHVRVLFNNQLVSQTKEMCVCVWVCECAACECVGWGCTWLTIAIMHQHKPLLVLIQYTYFTPVFHLPSHNIIVVLTQTS